MNNVRQNDRRRLRQDAYKRYQALDLVELQELIRERTGNFRRNKNRPTCIKKLMLLDLEHPQDDLAERITVPGPPLHELLKTAQMNYNAMCWTTELQDFIAQRTGDYDRNKCRPTCVRTLLLLDHKIRFRFLDLIPEIRPVLPGPAGLPCAPSLLTIGQYSNIIYELVIGTHNDEQKLARPHWPQWQKYDSSIAHPAILRANKQINAEASGYLYTTSTTAHEISYQNLGPRQLWPQQPTPPTPSLRHSTRNLTIFLIHWCDSEQNALADLVGQYLLSTRHGPLKKLKVILNSHCNMYKHQVTPAIGLVFLPLRGLLNGTDVQLVGFGNVLGTAARRALEGMPHAEVVDVEDGEEEEEKPLTEAVDALKISSAGGGEKES